MSDTLLELQLATAQQELKAVYRERDHLLATLSTFLPATFASSVDPDWSLLALPVDAEVTLFWNVAAENTDLFSHVPSPPGAIETDGRSTDEKYAVMREVTATMAGVVAELNLAGLPDLLAAMVDQEPEPEHTSPEPAPVPEVPAGDVASLAWGDTEEPAPAPAPLPKRNPRAKKAGA